jgi:hypothetical protein
MAGWRRVAELTKTRLMRAVSWLIPARTEALLRVEPLIGIERAPDDASAASSSAAPVSFAQEHLLCYRSGCQSSATATTRIRLVRLPLTKGLLNLVDIFNQDVSQGDQI